MLLGRKGKVDLPFSVAATLTSLKVALQMGHVLEFLAQARMHLSWTT